MLSDGHAKPRGGWEARPAPRFLGVDQGLLSLTTVSALSHSTKHEASLRRICSCCVSDRPQSENLTPT